MVMPATAFPSLSGGGGGGAVGPPGPPGIPVNYQIFTGSIGIGQTIFTLTIGAPSTGKSVWVNKDRLWLLPGIDFSVGGLDNEIVTITNPSVQTTDQLVIYFQ